MSMQIVSDVNNTFLSRREIVCEFPGLAGKLKKLDAADMISKQLRLDGKVIIPISMKNHSGRPTVRGTFYVYDDEELAKKQVNPTIFKRIDKIKAAIAAAAPKEEAPTEAPAEASS
jgi:ribosomal protein S24E